VNRDQLLKALCQASLAIIAFAENSVLTRLALFQPSIGAVEFA
jgi:hypothetical protein